jgi:hypothetical protein
MTLAEIIANEIPRGLLERVVCDQDIIHSAERGALFKPSGPSAQEVASSVVERYDTLAPRLARGLFEQIKNTNWQTAELLIEHFGADDPGFHNHEASLVSRIPDIPLDKLNQFLDVITGQICLIVTTNVIGQPVLGTGFLVGPDLVLTCNHVLKDSLVSAIAQSTTRIEVYFDFYMGGPVRGVAPNLPKARRVALAANWHVASSPSINPDGVTHALPPPAFQKTSSALDFVLFRLAEKVGLQTVDRNGGRRRQWVDLSARNLPQNVQDEDWVIIPQHPDGHPQRIDMGRFRALDCTGTRLRYDTNTAAGSSGAPCFNQDFQLLGVHNAYVGLVKPPILNQAISATCIEPLVKIHIAAAMSGIAPDTPATSVDRWSVTQSNEGPRVILGRETLLSWLRVAPTAKGSSLADRIYAAYADVPSAGCTFTIDVLEAETRDAKTPRAVYGQRGQQLPATAEDFLLSLLRELEIDLRPDQTIPYRPRPLSAEAATIGAGKEVDKLERWLSQELPEWLGRVITEHVEKKIDARPRTKEAIKTLIAQNIEVPPKLRATADSPEPVFVRASAWDFAYVVFDDLRSSSYAVSGSRTELKGEVLSLVAALSRGKGDANLHPGLKRLRWMFLGDLPDFVPAASSGGAGATVEMLDPAVVGPTEILTVFERMSQAYAQMKEGSGVLLPAMAEVVARSAAGSPEPRLKAFQMATNDTATILLRIMGV